MGLEGVEYKVSYRKVKYPRLEFKGGGLLLILPFGHDPEVFLEKHRDWIVKKTEFINECLRDSLGKEIAQRTEEEFRDIVYFIVERTSRELGVKVNNIFFRRMRTKWASCSPKRNLTINSLMKHLPEGLIEYIIFHEIAHLIEKRHNENFWSIILNRFNNYKELEKDLFGFWFLIQRSQKTALNSAGQTRSVAEDFTSSLKGIG
ncbi:MAG: hypothetical protein DRG50_02760 [Deltaproteobacteria bacterium]|nr:MAG: hypothetical protein DRG50_02760 [Deltaproteobacteria bacterium]